MKGILYLAALMLVTIPGLGQSAPSERENRQPDITSTSTLVIVPTLVRSPAGELVTNLGAGDFLLTDNGVEQKVSIEDVERQPLAVVVLLQTGGAGPRQLQNYRGVDTMLDYMMGSSKHRVAVVTFDSQPEEIWDFTRNVGDLKDAFTSPGNGDGKAAIVDAVDYGIDLLKQHSRQALAASFSYSVRRRMMEAKPTRRMWCAVWERTTRSSTALHSRPRRRG